MAILTKPETTSTSPALADPLGLVAAGANQMTTSGSPFLQDADVIITHAEVSDRHGVGKLLQMMFLDEPNIICIRSKNLYEGQHELGQVALCIYHEDTSREAIFRGVLDQMGEHTVRRVLCVPYFADDVRTAIAIKEIYGVPMCTYIMDDQNVYCSDGIPDVLMRELLLKSRLVLGISAEMCSAYRQKYGVEMWPMPPLVPGRLIPSRLNLPSTPPDMHGVIIGNIWGEKWIDLLRKTVRDSGIRLSWYCNGEFRWLPCGRESLFEDSIIPCDPLKDDPLVEMLRSTWFAVLPSGLLDESDDRRFISQLSLPSRVPYMMATSHIPILVLGSPRTAAGRFVERFGIGTVATYERDSFAEAVRYIMQPAVNLAMRRRALAAAARFTDVGAAEWIWLSLAKNRPIDTRFEDVIPAATPMDNSRDNRLLTEAREDTRISAQNDSPAVLGSTGMASENGMFAHERAFLQKLLRAGYHPEVVYDVGASNGMWSEAIGRVVPNAAFELFEPLAGYSTYSDDLTKRLRCQKRARLHKVALGEENGEQLLCVADDLYGSSLRDRGDIPQTRERIPVKVFRLDDFVKQNRLSSADIVKIDCQGAEDSVIRGGIQTISQADVLLLETWLVRGYGPKTPLLTELIELLRPLSFTVAEIGEKFFDERHRLYSVDAFFCSERLLAKLQLPTSAVMPAET